uniref:Uncharacterized protein n=1 Tax=Panagrolaimus sp. PS1159 TaxID=55785 RepID=A0AC35ER33_9BILA
MKLFIIFALFGTASALLGIGLGRTQSAGVRGQLVCDGKPATNVKVKLYDDDRGIDTDDLMASGKTDGSGHFDLQGYTHEFTTIDPKINIYHDCNDGLTVCDGKPATNVKVKLYDDDRGIDTDDLMASGKTDGSGHFDLQGYTHEFTTIDPKINIYHDCNDGLTPCQRKLSIMVPDKYITSGEHPERYFDAGVIELAGIFKGEERDCIH